MTSRERLIATLNHQPTDRLCVDFGAGFQTGMGAGAVHRLRQALLGQPEFRVKVSESYQMLGEIDEELRQALALDVVSGTDFGTQTGQFCSVRTNRELFKPFHLVVNNHIHKLTNWKTFIHSCGAVLPFIPDFIDAGFDVLNPVQCSALGMDPRTLKREFGKELVFWGGGVDTQKTLPFGTPDDVYREVRERIDIFSEGGGFVFNSVHNVQSNVPVPNLLALFRAIKDSQLPS
jgi:uroporphyrinogen-III decarboxylase